MTLSRQLVLFFATAALASGAQAQQTYGPADPARRADDDEPVPLVEPETCKEEVREDGAIVVCRELTDSQRFMSPLPRPVQSDRRHVPGLTDPPCWKLGLGPPSCIRMGSVPPYPPLIDTTAFPEPLTAAEAAAVSAVPGEEEGETRVTGERIPIDLSGD